MGLHDASIAVAVRVGNGYFNGNLCPENGDADTLVESLGSNRNGIYEYRVRCPVCGWHEYLRASEITQKDSDD